MFEPIHLRHNLLKPPAEVYYLPSFLAAEQADSLLNHLLTQVPWKQEPIQLFGKKVMQPRLTAWQSDQGLSYRYSGITMTGQTFDERLRELKTALTIRCGCDFNSVLLNLYRNGEDSMGWHRDNEPELGPEPVIASVSLGASRRFTMRMYKDKSDQKRFLLEHGSLLLMKGKTQELYEHCLPKTKHLTAPRINLTFRIIR